MAEAFVKWGEEGGAKPMVRLFWPTIRTGSDVTRNFNKGGGAQFPHFFQAYFEVDYLNLIKKKSSRGVQGHAPPEKF